MAHKFRNVLLERDVYHWDDDSNLSAKGLIPMNLVFRDFMDKLGEDRLDTVLFFAPSHTMLTLNRIFEIASVLMDNELVRKACK